MVDVCRAMGVRTDVPFCELSEQERAIVFDGPAVKRHILYQAKRSQQATELDFTYYNAVYTVENALAKVKDERDETGREVSEGGDLSGVSWDAPVGEGPGTADRRHLVG
ncbi:MAG: hypothetical protein ACLVJ6_02365 [Merdibacter sp.]